MLRRLTLLLITLCVGGLAPLAEATACIMHTPPPAAATAYHAHTGHGRASAPAMAVAQCLDLHALPATTASASSAAQPLMAAAVPAVLPIFSAMVPLVRRVDPPPTGQALLAARRDVMDISRRMRI